MTLAKSPNGRFTPKERAYFEWLSGIPCCLSGRTDGVQRAHIGDVTDGKGMGRKVAYNLVLPLHYTLHAEEEKARGTFWECAGIEDPRAWAVTLHSFHETDNREAAERFMQEMHRRANLTFVAEILTRNG